MLGEASELWRGAPLSDFDGWQDGRAEAARLDELRRDVEELRLEAALRAGRSLEVLAPARALVAEAPLRERRWALLALAQYQAGRQAEALSTLREVRTVLAAELALDAGPDLVALEQAILRQDPALLAERPRPDPSSTCPYQGLPPYGLDDDDRFFGREATVAAGLRRLAESGSLVVVGPSGSGKSSLVRAGLAAALRRDGRRPVVITPGARPMDALTGLSVRRGDVLVVDQCEEAFSQCADEQERSRFFRSLAEHAGRGPLVVTMRADRTGDLPAHPQFAQVVERGLFLLGPLGIEELRACIEGPAQQAGLLLEPGLVDLLLREVEDEAGALPLLSHALRETWSNREGPTLTVAGYVATGGIKGAVARTAEEVYGSVAPSQQPLVRDLMMRLVAPSGDDDPLPGRSPSRLPSRMVDDEEHRSIVELLVDARLVTVDDGVIELAHESLARNWPRLRGWLEEDVEGQRIRRHLTVAADAWESMGRPSTEVYRGVRLAQALDWRQRAQPVLTAAERAFLDESRAQVDAELSQAHARAEQERAARRRTRRFATGLAIALVVALVAAGTAIGFQRSARDRADEAAAASTAADANRIAAQSGSVGALDLSLLLAAEAARTADTPATRGGLLGSLIAHRRATRVTQLDRRPTDGELADRGRTLFVAAENGVIAWRVDSVSPAVEVIDWDQPEDIAASPTDDLVALWSVVDSATPQVGVFGADGRRQLLLKGVEQIGGWPDTFGFSPDGRRLRMLVRHHAARGPGWVATVREVDLATGSVQGRLPVQRSEAEDSEAVGVFSDDGSRVVSWVEGGLGTPTAVDLRTGARTRLSTVRRPSAVLGFHALPGGVVAQRWSDGAVALYDEQGHESQVLDVHRHPVNDVVVAPRGGWAATADDSGNVVVWDVDRRSGLWTQRESLEGHEGPVTGAAVDRTGRTLVTVSQDGTAISWDLSADAGFGSRVAGLGDQWVSNRPQVVLPGRLVVLPARPAAATLADFMLGRPVVAVFLDPRTGRVVDRVLVGGTVPGVLYGSSVAVSPDATKVAVTYGRGAAVLDTRTRKVLARIVLDDVVGDQGERGPEPVWGSVWTPDGSRLLLAADGERMDDTDGGLVVVDTETWTPARDRVDLDGAAQSMEVSPDGRRLAVAMGLASVNSAQQATVRMLDARTLDLQAVLPLEQGEAPFDLSFSPDGTRLAVGGDPGTLSVFDVATGRRLHEPAQLHTDFLQQTEWLDGDTVVTTGRDGMLSLYDAERGLVRAELPGSSDGKVGYTYLTSVTPQEVTAVTGAGDGRRYSLELSGWLDYACLVAGRDLTRDEWSTYLPERPYRRGCADREPE